MVETIETTETTEQAEPPQAEQPERFVIDTKEKAEWALRIRFGIESETAMIKAQLEQRLAELDADRAGWERRFGSEIKVWAEGEAAARNRKSVTLAYGTLAFRTEPARLVLADEEAALNHALQHMDFRAVKTTLDRAAYREAAEEAFENGELLPGFERVPESESFAIRIPTGLAKPKARKGPADPLEE